jgi:hypothetical protein
MNKKGSYKSKKFPLNSLKNPSKFLENSLKTPPIKTLLCRLA